MVATRREASGVQNSCLMKPFAGRKSDVGKNERYAHESSSSKAAIKPSAMVSAE